MQSFFKQTLCTFVLANIYVAAASPSAHSRSQQRRQQHQALARAEQEFPTNVTEGGIYPRGPNSRWSWYDTEETGNPGACGKHIKNSDFAVARPLSEFNFANDCFKQVTLTFEGRTAVATVLDACQICPPNGLDLSQGLFKYIAPNGDGIIHGNWNWGAQAEEPKPPKETTTKKPEPEPTPTSTTKTRKTTSTSTSTTSSSTSTTKTSTSTTETSTSESSTSTAALAAPTDTFDKENNLAGIQDVLVRMGDFVVVSGQIL